MANRIYGVHSGLKLAADSDMGRIVTGTDTINLKTALSDSDRYGCTSGLSTRHKAEQSQFEHDQFIIYKKGDTSAYLSVTLFLIVRNINC